MYVRFKEYSHSNTEGDIEFRQIDAHLHDEAVPSTTNNLERYHSHTKPTRIERRF